MDESYDQKREKMLSENKHLLRLEICMFPLL